MVGTGVTAGVAIRQLTWSAQITTYYHQENF